MNSNKARSALVLTMSLVAGCAVGPTVPIAGNTAASPKLQRDTEQYLRAAFQAKANCAKLDAVETEPIGGIAANGAVRERWIAIGCGKRMPVEFTFTPDGKGGTFIGFKL